jgi:hypothetical protein
VLAGGAACRLGGPRRPAAWAGVVRAQAKPAIGQQVDRLIHDTGSTIGRRLGERDADVSGGRVRQGDDPLGSASPGDRIGQDEDSD